MNVKSTSYNYENLCNLCRHFYPQSSYCTLIKFNVRDNPNIFLEKCDGKLFSQIGASDSSNKSKSRFDTLESLGRFIFYFGCIISTVIVIAVILGMQSVDSSAQIIFFIGGVISLINGILLVAVGQLISCFVSIERNTYETNNLLNLFTKVQR